MDNLRILKNVLAAWTRNQWEFDPFLGRDLIQDPEPQTKIFQQIWYQGLKFNILYKFEGSILKNKKINFDKNFDPFRGRDPKRDPKTKKFQQIWYQGLKINILCKFKASILKNRKFKILTLFGAGTQTGTPNTKIFQ